MLMDFSIEIFETKSENRLCICIAIETRFDFKSLIDLKWANENDEKKIRVTYFVAFSAKIAAVRATEVYKL